jgi:hypothetical protein
MYTTLKRTPSLYFSEHSCWKLEWEIGGEFQRGFILVYVQGDCKTELERPCGSSRIANGNGGESKNLILLIVILLILVNVHL